MLWHNNDTNCPLAIYKITIKCRKIVDMNASIWRIACTSFFFFWWRLKGKDKRSGQGNNNNNKCKALQWSESLKNQYKKVILEDKGEHYNCTYQLFYEQTQSKWMNEKKKFSCSCWGSCGWLINSHNYDKSWWSHQVKHFTVKNCCLWL